MVQYIAFHWKWMAIGIAGISIKPMDVLVLGWLIVSGGFTSIHGLYLLLGMLGRCLLLIVALLAGDTLRQRWLIPNLQYVNPYLSYAFITMLGSLWEVVHYMVVNRGQGWLSTEPE